MMKGPILEIYLAQSNIDLTLHKLSTVRPRDTRPQAARTSQVHVFELGPIIFELNGFM